MKKRSILTTFILVLAFIAANAFAAAQVHVTEESQHPQSDQHSDPGEEAGAEGGEFDPGEYILDHIADSHEWHLFTNKHGDHVSVYLPVIVYSRESRLNIFSSKHLAHSHIYNGFMIMQEGELKGRIVEVDKEGVIIEEKPPLDLSITKNVAAMIIVAIIILWLFISLAGSYRRSGISEPKGMQGFLEPVIVFIRDDIALQNIGDSKHERYMPYLLTIFFFILINNLMGLVPIIPGGANVTGNIAVTFTLAFITMVITNFSGSRGYWKHIFNTPGVPWWLKFPVPLMPVVELIGVIAKPFALMIRLFANITAGHIIVLSLVSLIFIFKSVLIAPVSIVFVLFMDCLEILVAFLQAYVFTLLSALFIGLAVQEHH